MNNKQTTFVKVPEGDTLTHWGVLGMKWGVRKDRGGSGSSGSNGATEKKFSKAEKKIIKKRKNELLNEVVSAEMIISKNVKNQVKSQIDENSPREKVREYMTEVTTKSNDYIKRNPSVIPKGMTIKYDKDSFAGDDFALEPLYTYNGKKVDFQFGIRERDRPFLDPPKELDHSAIFGESLTHYGVLGMKWGVRKDRKGSGYGSHLEPYRKKRLSSEKVGTARTVSNEGSNITSEGVRITKAVGNIRSANKTVDLSKMTDDELKILVARMNLEQQYANIASGQVSKGEVYTKNALEVTGSVLAIGSSAMAIALAMHKLKGG